VRNGSQWRNEVKSRHTLSLFLTGCLDKSESKSRADSTDNEGGIVVIRVRRSNHDYPRSKGDIIGEFPLIKSFDMKGSIGIISGTAII